MNKFVVEEMETGKYFEVYGVNIFEGSTYFLIFNKCWRWELAINFIPYTISGGLS